MDINDIVAFLKLFGIETKFNNTDAIMFLDMDNNCVMDAYCSKGGMPVSFELESSNRFKKLSSSYDIDNDMCIIIRSPKKYIVFTLSRPLIENRVNMQAIFVEKMKYIGVKKDGNIETHEAEFLSTPRRNVNLTVRTQYDDRKDSFNITDEEISFRVNDEYDLYSKASEDRMPSGTLIEAYESNEVIPKLVTYYGKIYPSLKEMTEEFDKKKQSGLEV